MKLNKIGVIFGIGASALTGMGALYAMDYLPPTTGAMNERFRQQAMVDVRQDISLILTELRDIRARIQDVEWELQTNPDSPSLLREKDDLEFELQIKTDELNLLKQKLKEN